MQNYNEQHNQNNQSGENYDYYGKKNHYQSNKKPYKQSNYNYNQKNTGGKHGVEDPYQAQMLLYRAEMYIMMRYPNLIDINSKHSGMANKISNKSQFFVIKSFSEEDVHKAIKYKVWSSTKTGNQTLNNSFKLTEEQGGEVYLFYSCNGSGRFVGMARMNSPVDEKNSFMYWTQDSKWYGLFDIEWIFIKDIPFKAFKNIDIMMKDGQIKPVTYSRDTQEVPLSEGKKMVDIIENYVNSNTILEHFEYYDMRQENYEKTLQMGGNMQEKMLKDQNDSRTNYGYSGSENQGHPYYPKKVFNKKQDEPLEEGKDERK